MDELVRMPNDQEVALAAEELGLAMVDKCDELAKKLFGQFTNDADSASQEIAKNADRSRRELHLELTKLRIRRAANMDLGGAVIAARTAGATWEQVGAACRSSRQAAYERWHKVVRKFEDARRKAEQLPMSVRDQGDPGSKPPIDALYELRHADPGDGG
ncbi:hypothetical protein ACFQZZ_14820 [Nocardia sp. GCM10030253]|uniref:hypothetical protein n=1 Tax=Nocardia sp. GCM10030253 TaxID=3273404 RepID=UPI00362678F2